MVDDGRTTDGRMTDGRTTEHGYTISSPCEPDGSGELTICICKNKAADQPCRNCTADQRLCFRSIDSALPLLLIDEISRFSPALEIEQAGLCRSWSETQIIEFHMQRLIYV